MNLQGVNVLLLAAVVLGLAYLMLQEIDERAELIQRVETLERAELERRKRTEAARSARKAK